MNVLYISYDGMTDPLGQSQVLPYLVQLSDERTHIFLVSCEKTARFNAHRQVIEDIASNAGITWVPLTYTKSPPVLSTIWDVLKIRRTVLKLYSEYEIDLVHCRSYITSLVGLQMKKKFGIPFVFDMRGFYADERVDGKIWDLKNPVYKLIYHYFKKKEKEFLEHADYSITLTYAARDIIHDWTQIEGQPLPIEVIPCCADLELFNPGNAGTDKASHLLAKNRLSGYEFILTYIGSLGTWYMPEEMMRFFKRLLLKRKDAVFFIVSPDDKQIIYHLTEELNIPEKNIRTAEALRDEVPLYISISSASIFFIKPVFSKKASSPTKQGEIMGMGIPIVCNSGVGDTDTVIRKYGAGWIVEDFTDEEFDKVINEMQSPISPENIRRGAREFYSLQEGVKRYRGIYDNLAAK